MTNENNYQQEKVPEVKIMMHPVFDHHFCEGKVDSDGHFIARGYTVREVLDDLCQYFPGFSTLYKSTRNAAELKEGVRDTIRGVVLILPDRNIDVKQVPEGLDLKVIDGEELAIIRAIQGG